MKTNLPQIGKHCTHNSTELVYGHGYVAKTRDVILLHVHGPWAMVQVPPKMPYVCHVKELQASTKGYFSRKAKRRPQSNLR